MERATRGFDAYRASLAAYSPERVERETGVPAALVERMALDYARADRAMICWTLGITEHHNGVNNVLGLINLALLTGHVGRWGSGLNPLRGQNNVQGGGDMGALPNKLTGFQDVEDDAARARFERAWGVTIPPKNGWNLTQMFDAMGRGELTALFVIGENPAQSEADAGHTLDAAPRARVPGRAGHLPHQDGRARRRRAPRLRQLLRGRGHRHQQRAPRAARAPLDAAAGQRARRHRHPLRPRAPPGRDLGDPTPEEIWERAAHRSAPCTPG